MEMFKESNQSQRVLLAGLTILIACILFSLTAIFQLQTAVDARRTAYENQDSFDELSKKVKVWALLVYTQPHTTENQLKKIAIEKEVDSILDLIHERVSKNSKETEIEENNKSIWEKIKKTKSKINFTI